jgi:hypothetical protein
MLPPGWLQTLQQIVLGILSGWLLLTIGVAFLREAKAVRDSRQLLAENHPDTAWELLVPFLKEHPRHEQGLLLGGQAAIRLNKIGDAKQYLGTLNEVSPKLGKELANDYRGIIAARAQSINCSPSGFPQLLAESHELGNSYQAIVMAGLQSFAEACSRAGNYSVPEAVSSLLTTQGNATDLVNKGYVPAIRSALEQARFDDAKALAQQSNRIVPRGTREINKVLEPERSKVTSTMMTLQNLCEALRSNPQYLVNGVWCFPVAAPPAVRTAKDAWGRAIVYTTLYPSPDQSCSYLISLSSYGFSGQPSTSDQQTPPGGATCRIQGGNVSWQLSDRFWLRKELTSNNAGIQSTEVGD